MQFTQRERPFRGEGDQSWPRTDGSSGLSSDRRGGMKLPGKSGAEWRVDRLRPWSGLLEEVPLNASVGG
jgi:hypothetical protein